MRSPEIAVLRFRLVALEPLSLGDPTGASVAERISRVLSEEQPDEVAVDIPVAQDPFGSPIVRGTSIFGSLRAHLSGYQLLTGPELQFRSISSTYPRRRRNSHHATLADLLCGSEPEEIGKGNARALRPSALRLVSSTLTAGEMDNGRARTAINRKRGAAEPNKLFRRARLLGATIEVVLQLDLPILNSALERWKIEGTAEGPGVARQALDDLALALAEWEPFVGGQIGAGSGRCRIEGITLGWAEPLPMQRFLQCADTLELLRSVPRLRVPTGDLQLCRRQQPERWRLEVPLECVDPLLVAPVASPDGEYENLAETFSTAPGSSWRGLIRSRAEYILRSCGVASCESSVRTCGRCPTCDLFGWVPGPGEPMSRGGAQGLLRFGDSVITGNQVTLDHAPIDRFTGGAAEAKFFRRTAWAPGAQLTLVVEQSPGRLPVPSWAMALIGLVLRDIDDGLVGLGNSTTRGYGTLRVADHNALPSIPVDWLDGVPPVREEEVALR